MTGGNARLPDGTELSDDQHNLLVAMSKRKRTDAGQWSGGIAAGLGWSEVRADTVLRELERLGLVVNTQVN